MRSASLAGPPLLALAVVVGCASVGSPGTTRTFARAPGLAVEESWSRYPVEGTERHEIGASMAENAPRKDGLPALGLTRWSLSWRFDLRRFAGTCRVVSPEVTAELEIVLPRLASGEPVDAPLFSRWQDFLKALTEHEEGHRRLVLEAGREVADRLRRAHGPTCALARREAERAARQIVADYDRRNRTYDAETVGGRKQGVRWP